MTYTTKDIANGKASVSRTPAGTQKRAAEVQSRFPAVKVIWGDGGGEHATGLALDFMVGGDHALGEKIATYLWDNRIRLGVDWIIWNRRIRNPKKNGGAWRTYTGDNPHTDHPHVKFSTTAYTAPPAPTPTPPKPSPPRYPGVQLRRGSRGAQVTAVQRRLKARGWTVAVDGSFGPALERTIEQFQQNKNLKADGVVGPDTWAALWALPIT